MLLLNCLCLFLSVVLGANTTQNVQGKYENVVAIPTDSVVIRCATPIISPHGGTYAGSVVLTLSSITIGSSICYNINANNFPSKNNSICVFTGSKITLQDAGEFSLKAIAIHDDMDDSMVASESFKIIARVATPVISPPINTFPTSALLTFSCSTPGSVIYYTIDEAGVPNQSSLMVGNDESIVIDTVGKHVIQAYATETNMLASEIIVKTITILERLPMPEMIPAPGKYVGNQYIKFHCPIDDDQDDDDMTDAIVYYTADGMSTPNPNPSSEKTSLHVHCDESILLQSPGIYTIRAIVTKSGKSPSSVLQAIYVLKRPSLDQYPVNPIQSSDFKIQPDVEIMVVEKDLLYSNYCPKRNIRGRLVVLHNPIGHFDVLPPKEGCSAGVLELPSISGRAFRPIPGFNLSEYVIKDIDNSNSNNNNKDESNHENYDINNDDTTTADILIDIAKSNTVIPPYIKKFLDRGEEEKDVPKKKNIRSLRLSILKGLEEQFDNVKDLGCQVVTNAGFFNTSSNQCFGNIISDGFVHQLSHTHNVNFGIRNGSFVVGYMTSSEILEASRHIPFDFLVSGVGWLVRDGKSYVTESFSVEGDAEDMSAQSTGTQFLTIKSARTAIGFDAEGNLLLLQVEGETWVRGMTLYEFTDLAIELGFISAINLDGGGSATMTQNHSLISEPSWKCIDPPYNKSSLYHCEKRVSSITCIHAMAPPFIEKTFLSHSKSFSPTLQPTSKQSVVSDTLLPTSLYQYEDTSGNIGGSSNSNTTTTKAQMMIEVDLLKRNLYFYQVVVFVLATILSLTIIIMPCIICIYNRLCCRNHTIVNSNQSQPYERSNKKYDIPENVVGYNNINSDSDPVSASSASLSLSYMRKETEMISSPLLSKKQQQQQLSYPSMQQHGNANSSVTIVDWKPPGEEDDDFYNDSDDADIEQSRPLTASSKKQTTTTTTMIDVRNNITSLTRNNPPPVSEEYSSSEEEDDDLRGGNVKDDITAIRPLLTGKSGKSHPPTNNIIHSGIPKTTPTAAAAEEESFTHQILSHPSSSNITTKLKKTTKRMSK